TCGGTLIRLSEGGYRVGVVDLTRGEMGTRGTAEDRAREAARAADVMGLSLRENLSLPDARLENAFSVRLQLAALLREHRPHLVILPFWEGRHPDHVAAGRLGYDACYLSGLEKLELGGEPWRPKKILYPLIFSPERPTLVVDITPQLERKIEAIMCYESQFGREARALSERFRAGNLEEMVRAEALHSGRLIGVRYGEPFFQKEPLAVEDPMKLPGRSI
ncbi:MAG: bacillithiol biosynthesis deacetylase BshB1, partial [Nitrospinota bacterium]